MNDFNKKLQERSIRIKILKIICIGWALLGTSTMLFDGSGFDLASYVIGIVIFPLAGVLAYKCLERIENRIKNFRKYEPIIAYEVACAIGQIANITGQGFEQTKGELKELIDYGYLPNRYINEMTGMLMMNNR